ncbi:uncharacterized protein LOC116341947 [Contarinia nasturtii]|uniref:uncharacterized protein LOC116341947 n=1 Tax=Contarinia nasturtii TaxID=265458 RepID=UPI0012D472A5|nr:uncharacterized protein LOC116341947 [Contarinia nasturtii]
MDFETSCWSDAGPLINGGGQTFYNYDNPVQRRPKIDYFDSSSIQPIVSHISSNGYYGYCPTPNIPCLNERASDDNQKATADDINGSGRPNVMSMESTITEQTQHQGRSMFVNRKRAVQSVTNNECAEQDAKRRRSHLSVIDYDEDMQISYDDNEDVLIDPSNIASNKLRFDQFCVYINENTVEMGHNLNETHQTESKIKLNILTDPNSNAATNTDDDDDHLTSTKESITNDMENLYWHTHGSYTYGALAALTNT